MHLYEESYKISQMKRSHKWKRKFRSPALEGGRGSVIIWILNAYPHKILCIRGFFTIEV